MQLRSPICPGGRYWTHLRRAEDKPDPDRTEKAIVAFRNPLRVWSARIQAR